MTSQYAGWEHRGVGQDPSTINAADESELGMFAMIDAFMKATPYVTAFITGGLKSSAADFVAQTQEIRAMAKKSLPVVKPGDLTRLVDRDGENNMESSPFLKPKSILTPTRKPRICLKRNFSFLLYGAVCCGVVYEWIYNVVFPRLFGYDTHLQVAMAKTGTEIFMIAPLFTIPTSYLITAAINRTSYRQALAKYWYDVRENNLLRTYCIVFGPFQIILFTWVPAYMRMTVASVVSFLWLMILSQVSASKNN
jgi:hypothetical protein